MKKAAWIILAILVAGGAFVFAAGSGWLGQDEQAGEVLAEPRPADTDMARRDTQIETARSLGGAGDKQILFGDFHAHTTFSFDAFMMNMPIAGGSGTAPPADACDFARFCSALDFWSINDHAETLTPDLWEQTVDSVRQCNAAAGDTENPDMVTYLGWEWSHIGSTPDKHYGHKNVVFRGLADDEIPTRPIASLPQDNDGLTPFPFVARAAIGVVGGERGRSFARFLKNAIDVEICPDDVPVRDLPVDCREYASTPEILFDKLADWGHDSIVIPHGTAWGIYTPAGSDWRKQLPGNDPDRQTLIEIYSGHGASEQLPPWRPVDVAPDGSLTCPPPRDGYLPSCWQAGVLIETRCKEIGESDEECSRRAAKARADYVAALQAGWKTAPGYTPDDWLDAGQAPLDMFQPAFNYRPRGSAQYILAIRDFSDPDEPKRFEMGFIGSSDGHSARPGTGYKEFARGTMTEGRGASSDSTQSAPGIFGSDSETDEPAAASVPYDSTGQSPLQLFEVERGSSYFATGGLVAVHATGRDRDSIWEALERKEVYATSGRRTLLWFDLLESGAEAESPEQAANLAIDVPMGSTVTRSDNPTFRARAIGSFEQKSGCPEEVIEILGADTVQALCLGECHNPGDKRRPITRIEVVRVRPQIAEDEPVNDLVDDPWRTFACPADGNGCVVEFSDPEFAGSGRDTVYYARAIEAPDELIHGSNPLGCTQDAAGRCIEVDPCNLNSPVDDDCLSEGEPRAWSSPIFVNHGGLESAGDLPGHAN